MTHPKPTKRPKGKKTTRQTAKKRADKAFGDYIKARDGGGCVQCGKQSELTCGHIYTSAHESTRWDEHNAMAQCRNHNFRHEFDFQPFYEIAVKRFGRKEMQAVHDRFEQQAHFKTHDLLEIEAVFKAKLGELNK